MASYAPLIVTDITATQQAKSASLLVTGNATIQGDVTFGGGIDGPNVVTTNQYDATGYLCYSNISSDLNGYSDLFRINHFGNTYCLERSRSNAQGITTMRQQIEFDDGVLIKFGRWGAPMAWIDASTGAFHTNSTVDATGNIVSHNDIMADGRLTSGNLQTNDYMIIESGGIVQSNSTAANSDNNFFENFSTLPDGTTPDRFKIGHRNATAGDSYTITRETNLLKCQEIQLGPSTTEIGFNQAGVRKATIDTFSGSLTMPIVYIGNNGSSLLQLRASSGFPFRAVRADNLIVDFTSAGTAISNSAYYTKIGNQCTVSVDFYFQGSVLPSTGGPFGLAIKYDHILPAFPIVPLSMFSYQPIGASGVASTPINTFIFADPATHVRLWSPLHDGVEAFQFPDGGTIAYLTYRLTFSYVSST